MNGAGLNTDYMPPELQHSPLPYTDTKPVGAADFYFCHNATFRFIEKRFGADGLRRYWRELGAKYYAPVTRSWKKGGLRSVADYWRAFFDAEPGSDVKVVSTHEAVTLEIRTCPAIKHLRDNSRDIIPCYCQHCYYVSEAMAAPAGLAVRIEGGNGSCRQTFLRARADLAPQSMDSIKEAK